MQYDSFLQRINTLQSDGGLEACCFIVLTLLWVKNCDHKKEGSMTTSESGWEVNEGTPLLLYADIGCMREISSIFRESSVKST